MGHSHLSRQQRHSETETSSVTKYKQSGVSVTKHTIVLLRDEESVSESEEVLSDRV